MKFKVLTLCCLISSITITESIPVAEKGGIV